MRWTWVRALRLALLTCLVVGVAGSRASTPVGADLNLSPKRLVFDDAGRSATLFVFNQGDQPATYNIELIDQAMTPEGRIERLGDTPGAAEAAGVRSAKPLVTFTPRRVTLGPQQSQTVRLRILRPADLQPGEYRSHLLVTAVPPQDTGLTADQAAAGGSSQELSVRVVAVFSLSIPVIVRQGAPDVNAGIEGVRYAAADPQILNLELVRKGASSLYGDVEVEAQRPGKPAEKIGGVRGVGVYPEIGRRALRVPLSRAPAAGERLTVTYRDDDTHPGAALATATYAAP
ncbi:molecular chaperone [Caulobacter sp. 17J80-11]|uniref:fimbrial biogenesis chaperone n=1 Tax=Caulobacter sp. 17J80-11 TaxID=2763502 RepID=UPI0016539A24|nr:molecular chaperone [Caulobacter sp. 17J80-11]MBC6981960.1 molecular chaperone [Caulobacter sp. 17J80-11]